MVASLVLITTPVYTVCCRPLNLKKKFKENHKAQHYFRYLNDGIVTAKIALN